MTNLAKTRVTNCNPSLQLIRVEQFEDSTLGILLYAGRMVCLTLEPGWHGNLTFKSCIPLGEYEMNRRADGKWLVDVPSRIGILFHAGNHSRDSKGCILPGMELREGVDGRVVLHSRDAMEEFDKVLSSFSKATLEVSKL
jgi:hypothetical protein